MTDRTLVIACRAVSGIGACLAVASTAYFVPTVGALWLMQTEAGVFLLFATAFAAIVWLVAPRQPRNAVVWILAASTFGIGLYTGVYALGAISTGDVALLQGDHVFVPAEWPLWFATLLMVAFLVNMGLLFTQLTLGLLLFPDGRLPSPRWRPVAVFSVVAAVQVAVSTAWLVRPSNTVGQETDPVSISIATLAVVMCAFGLAARFRKSTGIVRQQLKWVLWGAGVLVVGLLLLSLPIATTHQNLALAIFTSAGAVFVGSYGIALGKYRLFDVDVVISRTFVYGTLALFITGVYVAAVVGIGSLIGGGAESNPWLSITATGVVAFAFEPVRERLHRTANRLVYGRSVTPYEVLSDFSRRIVAGDDVLLDQVARSLAEGTTAAAAEVWVWRDGVLGRAAVWPEDSTAVEVAEDGSPAADLVEPVLHDGEQLGMLTLRAARGQPLLPTDRRLLKQMAAGMGLALRNARLSEDLRFRVEQLQDSRQRLVGVQDETRRHLERRLHDGAQQRLVALKVKLALTRKRAETAGHGDVAAMLDQVTDDTDRAIESLRDFARGIYPPLLEAEGPAVALASQVSRLPLPISLRADGVSRYPRPVEAAVYFCVLEALQNVVKHADASSATVDFSSTVDGLSFEVSDDGKGFSPHLVTWGSGLGNLADRLDALDGTLEVLASPEGGTTVRGTIPVNTLETLS